MLQCPLLVHSALQCVDDQVTSSSVAGQVLVKGPLSADHLTTSLIQSDTCAVQELSKTRSPIHTMLVYNWRTTTVLFTLRSELRRNVPS